MKFLATAPVFAALATFPFPCERPLAGNPVKVVVIGGSITCGGNTYTEDQRWINQVFQWINATWPHPEHKLTNACKPATPSMLFSFCMHQSVPDDTDLLFMEVRARMHHDNHYTSFS